MASLPMTNVSIMNVRNILAYPSTDLGTLCTCPNINIWAKYKPLASAFTYNRPTEWWRGTNNHCGINYITYSRMTDFIEAVNNNTVFFTHDKPTGGTLAPYRLGDFCGYNHNAVPPIMTSNIEGEYYQSNGNMGVACLYRQPMEGELSVEDVFDPAINGRYFGVVLVSGSGSSMTYRWMTAEDRVSNSTVIQVPLKGLQATTYKAYFFLTSTPKPSFTTQEAASEIMAIPGTQGQEVKIKATNIIIYIQAQFVGGGVSGKVTVNNQSGETVRLTNCAVHLRYGNKDVLDAMVQGEAIVEIDNFSISPNSSVIKEFSQLSCLQDYATMGGGKAYFFTNNQVQAQTAILMQSN